MSDADTSINPSTDQNRATNHSDSVADATAAVLLVLAFVAGMTYWVASL